MGITFCYVLCITDIYNEEAGGGAGGGMFGVGKSNAKVYVQKETGVTFKDVAGQEEAKESVVELVDFLHNRANIQRLEQSFQRGHC